LTDSAVPASGGKVRQKLKIPAVATPQERRDYWQQFFENEIRPEVVHEVVSDLIDNKKYEDAISCIEQAILHSQIQP